MEEVRVLGSRKWVSLITKGCEDAASVLPQNVLSHLLCHTTRHVGLDSMTLLPC